jgi:hypothetical protein
MKIKVKNRSNGSAIYTIPELGDKKNVRREFAPLETRDIDSEEIEALAYVPGGQELLKNYLQILDKEAIDFDTEPEYHMSEEDIINLMKEGSLEAFLDCLDFALEGVLDLIKGYSVSLPLESTSKREALLNHKRTQFDVSKALLLMKAANEEESAAPAKERRVKGSAERRAQTPQYKIVK